VAFGWEWFFGNDGIDRCPPKGTVLGEPNEIIKLGKIELKEEDFMEIIHQLADSTYK
jgi:desumoylating isopeptidase 1